MAASKLTAGDRIALTAKFLKSTGQFTGAAGQRRGTYLGPLGSVPGYGLVRWDDEAAMLAASREEDDYKAHVREFGSTVCLTNIARVGSARFALNDL